MSSKIKSLMRTTKRYFGNFRMLTREYDLGYTIAFYADIMFPPGKNRFYIRSLTRYMRKEMRPITKKYREGCSDKPVLPKRDIGEKTPIWICWWQGEEEMPPVVKACFNRLKAVIPRDKAEVHLITEENVGEYIDLPEQIVAMRREGSIMSAHYADYLRYELVYAYGGIWLDSTVYLSSGLDERFFDSRYFTQRYKSDGNYRRLGCRGKWNNFYFSAEKSSVLCSYVCDALQYWYSRHKAFPDYVFLDYIIMAAYLDVPVIRELIDSVPPNNEDMWSLSPHLNDPYSKELYRKLMSNNGFFKLTYKIPILPELEDGTETIGHRLLNENGVEL